jgi:pimeloyl-ACP methyl ester carboxylesterase
MGVYRFAGRGGIELACRETGSGRPLVLLHGFMGAGSHMLGHGRAGVFAERGYRVIMPDFRGHGDSAKPHDPAAYPPDVLADDGLALVGHLGLGDGDYDLGGYSLGGRIVVRMLVRGARPGRAIVAGQGLAKVSGPQGGGVNHRVLTALTGGAAIEPGSADARIAHWISELGADPVALLHVLNSLVPTQEDALRQIAIPTLVAIGDKDERSDADELAALLRDARFVRVPGDHGSAFAAPELTAAIAAFLAER